MRHILGSLGRSIARLRSDTAGNVLMLSAAAIFVIIALVGGAVDMSRAYRVKSRLQTACDAGALAGRRAVDTDGFDSDAQTQANTFFALNFDKDQQDVTALSFTPSSSDDGVTVDGNATATVPLVLMKVFGFSTIDVSANCTATEGVGNVDVTFVLDTTGSMSNTLSGSSTTRLAALQLAMKSFYTTLDNATASSSARVRYAFVPYSSTVNVGRLLYNLSPSYLVDSYGVQSRVARFNVTVTQIFSGTSTSVPQYKTAYYATPNSSTSTYSGSYSSLNDCIDAMPSDTAWTNNGSSSSTSTTTRIGNSNVSTTIVTQPQIMRSYTCGRSGDIYYIYYYSAYRYYYSYTYSTSASVSSVSTTNTFDHFDYKMAKVDTSSFKAFSSVSTTTGSNGASESSTWGGCIEERHTVSESDFSYSSDEIYPTDATDLDIDTAPSSDDSSKWAPMWSAIAYYRTTSSSSKGTSLNSALVSVNGSQPSSPCPAAASGLAEMSQTAFNSYASSLTAAGNTYHDIGMLWGARLSSPTGIFSSVVTAAPSNGQTVSRHLIFMTDGEPQANYYSQQAYGIEYHDKRITDDGSSDDDTRHENRFRALCDAVKAKGIRIWVIGFTTSLTSDLSYCASSNSSYTASDASGLNTAFQNIAKQIGELRIDQ
ncbi:MAG: Tad domain-containing protein [Sphingobium sp.]